MGNNIWEQEIPGRDDGWSLDLDDGRILIIGYRFERGSEREYCFQHCIKDEGGRHWKDSRDCVKYSPKRDEIKFESTRDLQIESILKFRSYVVEKEAKLPEGLRSSMLNMFNKIEETA